MALRNLFIALLQISFSEKYFLKMVFRLTTCNEESFYHCFSDSAWDGKKKNIVEISDKLRKQCSLAAVNLSKESKK